MLKKVILTVLFLCFLCTGCGNKKALPDDLSTIESRGEIIAGVRHDTRPFGFKNSSAKPEGYEVDLAGIIAKNLLGSEDKVKFVPVTASDRIMKLNSGKVDMLIATMSITPQREAILNFSSPYYIAGQAVMVNSSSKATGLMDFAGKKVIIVFGSTSERNVRMNVPEVSVTGYKTYTEAYKALKAGKAEAMIADDTILLGFAVNDRSVRILPKRYSREPYAVVFRKEHSEKLQSKVNMVIDNLKSTGQLNRLQEKWDIR
ncbi:MAG: transporter substrate-binding domain-containing protein [Heliobacteriaceae bacterium]|nr:transporter substrate-binding domain-containing protein [Heliobacteriaceae bacterium]